MLTESQLSSQSLNFATMGPSSKEMQQWMEMTSFQAQTSIKEASQAGSPSDFNLPSSGDDALVSSFGQSTLVSSASPLSEKRSAGLSRPQSPKCARHPSLMEVEKILAVPEHRDLFLLFAKENYCEENVDFLTQSLKYQLHYKLLADEAYRLWQRFAVEKKLNLPQKLYDRTDVKVNGIDNAIDGDIFGDINEYISRLLAVDNDLIESYYRWRENLQSSSFRGDQDQSRASTDDNTRCRIQPRLPLSSDMTSTNPPIIEKEQSGGTVLDWMKKNGELSAAELELFMSSWTFLCNQVLITELNDDDCSSDVSDFSFGGGGNSREKDDCTIETITGVENFTRLFYNELFLARPTLKTMFESASFKMQKKVLVVMLQFIIKKIGDEQLIAKKLAELGRRHVIYGVTESDYQIMAEVFGKTLANLVGSTDEEKEKIMQVGTKVVCFVSKYMIAEVKTTPTASEIVKCFNATNKFKWKTFSISLSFEDLQIHSKPGSNKSKLKETIPFKWIDSVQVQDQVPESKRMKSNKKDDVSLVMELILKDNTSYLFLFSSLDGLISFENELLWRLLATTRTAKFQIDKFTQCSHSKSKDTGNESPPSQSMRSRSKSNNNNNIII